MAEKDLFERAVALVLRHEGGYVHDKRDPGGETKYGISKRSYPDLDIPNLTVEQAKAIYRRDWWDRHHYDRLAAVGGEKLAVKVFDLAVNMGATQAHRLLQRAAIRCSGEDIEVDGILGPKTLAAVAACADPEALLTDFSYRAVAFYRSLGRPRFLSGWINRVGDFEGFTEAAT